MLSEAIREMRHRFGEYRHTGMEMSEEGVASLDMALRAYEIEARNMEERLRLLTGADHAPLAGGSVLKFPKQRSPLTGLLDRALGGQAGEP